MSKSEEVSGTRKGRDLSRDLKEQALQIINASLDEARTQHPLDISQILEHDRPTLGDNVPLQLYRAVRLLAFREVLGSRISAAILGVSGRSVARKMGIESLQEVISALHDLSICKLTTLERNNGHIVFVATECSTCSGLPNIGEAVCHFEAGFIAGGLEPVFGGDVQVTETECWGLGNRVCRWEATLSTDTECESSRGPVDPLELIMSLASKAASSVDNAIAIRQKNRQLREAYHRLRESERLKKDLTDMVIHDMRMPLTAIMGSIETLSDLAESRMGPREQELLKMALSGSQTLLNMVNDLLDISKLEERQVVLRKSSVAVNELVEPAIEQVGILARRRRLALDVELGHHLPKVVVDRDRMVRVLVNLLGNAVHHTPPGGRILLTAIFDAENGEIRVSIHDTGEGIPKEYHDKIFDKFVQVESQKSRRKLSTGLGLTFCKLVTEAHGGRIWVESEPGIGSTFTFTIPVEQE